MPKIFQGLKFMLVGVTSSQRKIMSQNIISEGGTVIPLSATLFGPTAFNVETTHILVDQRSLTYEGLCSAANCLSIPQTIPVVHNTWVITCCHKKALVDTAPFLVSPTTNSSLTQPTAISGSDEPPRDQDESAVTETDLKRSRPDEESNPSSKRLKSDSESRTSWNRISLSSLIDDSFIPIIPQDIDYSSFAFDSWHEYSGILFKFQRPFIEAITHSERDNTIEECSDKSSGQTRLPSVIPVVAFDLDHNIITTKSGNVYAKSHSDWKLWHRDVPRILQQLPKCEFEDGIAHPTQILIISNQGGLNKFDSKDAKAGFCEKIDKIGAELGVPISFICSLEVYNVYRKPLTGMWEFYKAFLQHHVCDSQKILTSSVTAISTQCSPTPQNQPSIKLLLYVGDAAGRPAEGIRKKDFSDSDLKFALNAGVPFQTPEVFFLSSGHRLHRDITCKGIKLIDLPPTADPLPEILSLGPTQTNLLEIVLMVGPPATGKSTLAKRMEENGYYRVNQDTLKTMQKCLASAKSHLLSCKAAAPGDETSWRGVVVDNTNLDIKVRKLWVDLAKELSVEIRAVCLDVPYEVAATLEKLRSIDPLTAASDKTPIPSFVLGKFFKERAWPTISEGFRLVTIVPLSVRETGHPITRRLMSAYLTSA